MEKTDILNLETRRLLYNFIVENPGLHLREIARRLNLTFFNLNYHIRYLEKLGMISTKKDEFYTRVYPKESFGFKEKEIMDFIRRKTPRHILMCICAYPAITQNEIAKNLEKHPTTVKYHLKKLIELDIIEEAEIKDGLALTKIPSRRHVERTPVKNETIYRLKNPPLIYKLFLTNKKSLYKDKIFKIALEYVLYATYTFGRKRIGKNIWTDDKWFDLFEEVFYDIFPHPYHV
jgi:DNA-binding MarR family transcriptional regulator